MKKTYYAPKATAIKIETVGMLAGSETLGLHSGDAGAKGNPGSSLGHSNDGDDW